MDLRHLSSKSKRCLALPGSRRQPDATLFRTLLDSALPKACNQRPVISQRLARLRAGRLRRVPAEDGRAGDITMSPDGTTGILSLHSLPSGYPLAPQRTPPITASPQTATYGALGIVLALSGDKDGGSVPGSGDLGARGRRTAGRILHFCCRMRALPKTRRRFPPMRANP
ncbi:hypothetical protein CYMTET_21894 [Cymbomonas tetramitiformis]|uniref:Uncharacterized protein n=1 Tax=Cymbomonas tetramitiformis TaxID=36881 RepID=A0AAE0G1Y0_9CHLO|nr:hypothetical protein CYMTET_21894 [Cymbomonas tetramitiformis]